MKVHLKIAALVLLGIVCLSCTKEIDNGISNIPAIEIKSVFPTTIEEFDGNVIVNLGYTDGDGDLGFLEADSLALEVQDSRLTNPDYYYVPPLALLDHQLSIQGTLEVVLNGAFILGNGTEEKTTFTFRIKDRKGQWSNLVTTPEITITK